MKGNGNQALEARTIIPAAGKKKGSAGTKLAALKARKTIAAAREKSAGAELGL